MRGREKTEGAARVVQTAGSKLQNEDTCTAQRCTRSLENLGFSDPKAKNLELAVVLVDPALRAFGQWLVRVASWEPIGHVPRVLQERLSHL